MTVLSRIPLVIKASIKAPSVSSLQTAPKSASLDPPLLVTVARYDEQVVPVVIPFTCGSDPKAPLGVFKHELAKAVATDGACGTVGLKYK